MKLIKFFAEVINRVIKNDLIAMANELTFKLSLAVFPFLIFVLTIIAYLNIEYAEYISYVLSDLPRDVSMVISAFLREVVYTRPKGLMSVSLLVALYSASSGFHSFIKGLNRAYGVREKRNFFFTRLISLFLVLLFSVTIMLSIYILIIGSQINQLLLQLNVIKAIPRVNSLEVRVMMAIVMLVVVTLVYQLGANVKVKVLFIFPGTMFTMAAWFILSKLFNIYITKFASYSAVYGSISTIFVFALWMNMLCIALLVGCQINAVLCDREYMEVLLSNGRKNKGTYGTVQQNETGNINGDNRSAGNN